MLWRFFIVCWMPFDVVFCGVGYCFYLCAIIR
nr:MAG TPA: G-protein coupled receptor [Caudoviricetes sp.]